MFACVALFGLFTIVFGVSTLVWLSVVALALAGAADMVSVYIRETLIQLWTPDAVRGRVSAVNMVFVGASNELGEFRAGTVAALDRRRPGRGHGRHRHAHRRRPLGVVVPGAAPVAPLASAAAARRGPRLGRSAST